MNMYKFRKNFQWTKKGVKGEVVSKTGKGERKDFIKTCRSSFWFKVDIGNLENFRFFIVLYMDSKEDVALTLRYKGIYVKTMGCKFEEILGINEKMKKALEILVDILASIDKSKIDHQDILKNIKKLHRTSLAGTMELYLGLAGLTPETKKISKFGFQKIISKSQPVS